MRSQPRQSSGQQVSIPAQLWWPVALVPIVCFIVVLFAVFSAPLLSGLDLTAPDLRPDSVVYEQQHFPAHIFGGWQATGLGNIVSPLPPTPARVLLLKWLSVRTYRYAAFMLNSVLLFLAMGYLLRTKGLQWFTCATGALLMAFCGQTFTIIAAGHLGKFTMMPFVVLMFAFLDQAIRRRSFFRYLLAGTCAAIGMFEQMDVMFLFCLLGAAYTIFMLIRERPSECLGRYVGRQTVGLIIALAAFLVVAMPTIQSVLTIIVPSREATMNSGGNLDAAWDFATGWSMPPEELVEFLAPSIYGIETGDDRVPYWGRLGRSTNWEHSRRERMNLRQHTVYLGVVGAIFAVYAMGMAWQQRRRTGSGFAGRSEVPFWVGTWLIATLLALGRYGPLYKLFFMIPGMHIIRGPVKFTHLVEFSTVVLFAIGLDLFLRRGLLNQEDSVKDTSPRKVWPIGIWICLAAAVIFALGAVAVIIRQQYFLDQWNSMGFSQVQDVLMNNMLIALLRAAGLFLIGAGVFWASARSHGNRLRISIIAALISFVVAVDIGSAAGKYVKVTDLDAMYGRNDFVDALVKFPNPKRLAILPGEPLSEYVKFTLAYHGITFLSLPAEIVIPDPATEFTAYFRENPLRFMAICSAEYLLLPTQMTTSLRKHPRIQTVAFLAPIREAGGKITIRRVESEQAPYVLLSFIDVLPRATVYHAWRTIAPEELRSELQSPAWNPLKTVLVTGAGTNAPAGGDTSPARIVKHDSDAVEIECKTDRQGILLLNDFYDSHWVVSVDGKTAPLLRCNGIMRGVLVEQGQHLVQMVFHSPFALAGKIQLIFLGCVAILVPVRMVRRICRRS